MCSKQRLLGAVKQFNGPVCAFAQCQIDFVASVVLHSAAVMHLFQPKFSVGPCGLFTSCTVYTHVCSRAVVSASVVNFWLVAAL